MADVHDRATRSRNMAAIRGADTKPEKQLRSALHGLGFRYRLHATELPDRPALVLRKWNCVVFVHGCFWHGHGCRFFRLPATRRSFWRQKIDANRKRDGRIRKQLLDSGWRVATTWECAMRGASEAMASRRVTTIARWIRGSTGYSLTMRGSR